MSSMSHCSSSSYTLILLVRDKRVAALRKEHLLKVKVMVESLL